MDSMKKQKTIEVNVNKLDSSYKYVSNGGKFKKGSVCQMIRNTNDGLGAFQGISSEKTGPVIALTDIVNIADFTVTNKDGNLVDIKYTM